MSCNNCMSYRPSVINDGVFTCPECGQQYKLAGVGPGNYWEKINVLHPVPKQHIFRSEKYLDFIRSKLYLICDKPAEPHHERRYSDGGMGLTPLDIYAVPLCREHHGQAQRYEILGDALTVYVQIMKLLIEYLRGKI